MTFAILIALFLACTPAGAQNPLRSTGPGWPPVIGAWFWHDDVLELDGYKPFLDAAARHSPYTLLSTSLRISKGEVVDPAVREQIGQAVRYANSLGLKIAFDFDVRLARRAFQSRYPDELQQELVLKFVDLPVSGDATVTFEGKDLTDHMTGRTIPYQCLATGLMRVYTFVRSPGGIDPATVQDITHENVRAIADGPRKLSVTVPAVASRSACVIAAHTYLTPDVFAPHLLEFQRSIVQSYSALPLAGVMKDEWGFLPDHTGNPGHDRYWYSPAFANAYADGQPGRDLVRDALLMAAGESGRERERQAAINRYFQLCRQRNATIEDDFYQTGKQTFGPESVVVTHATWTPFPGAQEFRKNGLDWWDATRDLGQTDESAPYPCRTSLAKRWGFPLWYNQFYAPTPEPYTLELWAGALSGGRVNFHPLYPRKDPNLGDGHLALLQQPFLTGVARLRLLDFITQAPLDCPTAVIFGHACAMNWAGPAYNRTGLEIASALGERGYPADLIPSSLVESNALRIDRDGFLCLGPQRYRAVVLHQPEFGSAEELRFLVQAARGQTAWFVVGEWTRDATAQPLDGSRILEPVSRRVPDTACAATVTDYLDHAGIPRVTAWLPRLKSWGQPGNPSHAAPPADGFARLTDGTCIRVAGNKHAAGDPIVETFTCGGVDVAVDAVGLVALRFAPSGEIEALAAGGLKHLRAGQLELDLPERADVAFKRAPGGGFCGVLQGLAGPVPGALLRLTGNWQRLDVPPLLKQPATTAPTP